MLAEGILEIGCVMHDATEYKRTVAYPLAADNVSGPLPIRLRRVHQPVISPPNVFSRTL